jgi:hypothetical protein
MHSLWHFKQQQHAMLWAEGTRLVSVAFVQAAHLRLLPRSQ